MKRDSIGAKSQPIQFDVAEASRISRRRILQLAGASATLPFFFGSSRPGLAQEAAPKRGGNLVIAADGASSTDILDPLQISGNYLPIVALQLHNTLVDIDPQGALVPQLAESWESSDHAKRWVFKLRKDVTFHNGKPFDAADVVYTLNRHLGEDSASPIKVNLAAITAIEATDSHEITITLAEPDADLPYVMLDYHLGILPAAGDPSAGVGTGAFILDTFQPGVRTLARRNPNYWRDDRGFVDTVETLAINDPVARLSALLSGRAHLVNKVEPALAASVESNPQFQLFNATSGSHCIFPMRTDVAPFDNADFRMAMKYAVDREQLVNTVLHGYGRVGNDQPIPPSDPYFAADIPQTVYDPDKARFHLNKSGFSGSIPLHVSDTAFGGAVTAAEVMQSSASRAGVDIQIVREPADGYWDNVWLKKPFCASNWSGRPTANLMLSIAYKSDAAWNETAWRRPEFDKILIAVRGELDAQRRKEMYRDLQMMIHSDGGALIPMFNNYLDGASKAVKGFVPMSTFELSGYRVSEQVWLDA